MKPKIYNYNNKICVQIYDANSINKLFKKSAKCNIRTITGELDFISQSDNALKVEGLINFIIEKTKKIKTDYKITVIIEE